ncbi:hypothetical protein ACWQF4_000104 [Enterobacter kobei]
MSNIDKQWLQQKIAEMEDHRDLFPSDLDDDHASVLSAFRIAIASLEAEPVAYIRSAHNPDGFCFADGIHPTHRHQRLPLSTLQDGCYWKVTPLYTALPAPVAVPEDIPDSVYEILCQACGGGEKACNFADELWNACRAAMLHGADCNSPVIPDGWVLVPIDMAPEMMRAVQVNSELGAYAATNLYGAYSLFREFWDVAVTAAPQQEVK